MSDFVIYVLPKYNLKMYNFEIKFKFTINTTQLQVCYKEWDLEMT